ncbi:MAG: hypothetical protein K6F61_04015 [Clostridiales bacterium]|nr:hypothetical protein [Clostridiales bacterium]
MRKLMILAILLVTAMAIVDLTYREGFEPDEVYEMCNKRIVWTHEK